MLMVPVIVSGIDEHGRPFETDGETMCVINMAPRFASTTRALQRRTNYDPLTAALAAGAGRVC
jgi:hypothetical protein